MLVGSSIIFILAFSRYLIQPNHQYFVSSHNGTPKETVSASVCANTTSLVAQFIGKVKVPEGPDGHWPACSCTELSITNLCGLVLLIFFSFWLTSYQFEILVKFSIFLGQGLGYNTMTLGHWYIGF